MDLSSLPFRILTVCTGNICRSPVAERLLQAGLNQIQFGSFEVRSAGTRAMVGKPIQPHSAEIIKAFGGTSENFAARQLTPKILGETDLVLTMAAEHRGQVLQQDASLLRRTFTVREFARMLDALAESESATLSRNAGPASGQSTAAFWRELPAKAAAVRYLSLASDAGQDDVIDPYRRGPEIYRQMEDELAPALLSILRFARISAGG